MQRSFCADLPGLDISLVVS